MLTDQRFNSAPGIKGGLFDCIEMVVGSAL